MWKLFFSTTSKDSLVLFTGALFSTLLGLFLVFLLTRNISTVEFGLFMTALIFSQLMFDFFELGINSSTINFIAGNVDSKNIFLKASFVIKFLVGFILAAIIFIFAQTIAEIFFNNKQIIPYIQVSSIAVLFFMILQWGQSVFQAEKKFLYSALITTAVNFLRTLVVLSLLFLGILNGFNAFLISQISLFLILIFILQKLGFTFLKTSVNKDYYLKILKFGLPVGTGFALAALYTKLDQILIFNLAGESEAGIYGLAYRLIFVLILFSTSFSAAITPRFVSLEKSEFNNYFKKTLLMSGILALFSWFSILLTPIIPLVFGAEYIRSIAPLQILLLGGGFFILSSPFLSAILYRYKKTYFSLIISLISLVGIWFLLNNLIPLYKSIGAATSVTIVYFAQLIIIIFYYLKVRHD